jgi:hypothetical protein
MSTVRIQVRRGTAADWSSVNPILAAGEMGVETDTNKFKFGNGTGAWNTLSYAASDAAAIGEISQDAINTALSMGAGLTKSYNDGANTITISVDSSVIATKAYVDQAITDLGNSADGTYVPEADKGAAFGVASLDADAHVPAIQISDASVRGKLSGGTGINYNSSTGEIAVGTSIATRTYVDSSINTLVNGAPAALDTINELAAAIANDANYATTVTTALATKAPLASPTFTGTVTIPAGASISGYVTTSALEADYSTTASNDAAYLSKTDASSTYLTQNNAASTYLALSNADERITDTAAGMIQVTSGNGLGRVWSDSTNTLTLSIDQTVIDTVSARDAAVTTALATAAADATTKADGAVTTAAADATTKANTAKSEAITAAGTAADTKISTHNSATTNVHGIADTAALATKSYVDTADALKAPLASPTFTGTVSGITKSMVGLGNVDNTADSAKPISTATQTALDLKAPLASPALTGVPTAPTASAGTNTTQVATTAFVGTAVSNLVASAPAALDTLNELAAALGNDASFSTTITNSLAAKAPLASPALTGTATAVNLTVSGTTDLSASGVKLSDGTQTKVGVPSITTISQKTANYTLSALTERDSMIEMNSASATTLTVPTNATVAYPVGTSIDLLRVGAGAVDVAAASGVTINATPGLKLRAQWSSATLVKRATDTWVLIGDLSA